MYYNLTNLSLIFQIGKSNHSLLTQIRINQVKTRIFKKIMLKIFELSKLAYIIVAHSNSIHPSHSGKDSKKIKQSYH